MALREDKLTRSLVEPKVSGSTEVTGANRGTWIRLILDSFRLVQHDAIASRMREKYEGPRP